jgi:hypothetical protein
LGDLHPFCPVRELQLIRQDYASVLEMNVNGNPQAQFLYLEHHDGCFHW